MNQYDTIYSTNESPGFKLSIDLLKKELHGSYMYALSMYVCIYNYGKL